MPETLLAWFNRFTDDPKKVEARIKGRPVLLYEPPEQKESTDDDDDFQFRTQTGLETPSIGGGEPLAAVIEKTKDNAFQRRVTVGRTANNDLVLDDVSVSRFHAWFQQDEGSGDWQVVDAGSRNGTVVSGRRIAAKTPTTLSSGTRLKVGQLELTYYSAEAFLKLLKKQIEA
jgi:pSer/pThr/pTyr-binding forkhead associated (FHA) protein